MNMKTPPNRKKVDIDRIEALEQVVLELALYVERCPFNGNKVADHILGIMDYAPLPKSLSDKSKKKV